MIALIHGRADALYLVHRQIVIGDLTLEDSGRASLAFYRYFKNGLPEYAESPGSPLAALLAGVLQQGNPVQPLFDYLLEATPTVIAAILDDLHRQPE